MLESGLFLLKPIMRAEKYREKGIPSITAEVDDCDCKQCVENRGIIEAGSAIRLEIRDEGAGIMQLMSAEEAVSLAKALMELAAKTKEKW